MKEKLRILLSYLKEKLLCSFVIYYTDADKKDMREDLDNIKTIKDLSQCESKKKEIKDFLFSAKSDMKERNLNVSISIFLTITFFIAAKYCPDIAFFESAMFSSISAGALVSFVYNNYQRLEDKKFIEAYNELKFVIDKREEIIKAKQVELSSNRTNSREVDYLKPISYYFDTDFSNNNDDEYPIGYGVKSDYSIVPDDLEARGRAYSKKRPGYRN